MYRIKPTKNLDLVKLFKTRKDIVLGKIKTYYNLWLCMYKSKPLCLLTLRFDDTYIYGVDITKIKAEELEATFAKLLKQLGKTEIDVFEFGIDRKCEEVIIPKYQKLTHKYLKKEFSKIVNICVQDLIDVKYYSRLHNNIFS